MTIARSLALYSLPLAAVAAIAVTGAGSALAQRQQASPEQRIERLEKQLSQMQRQVFPKGRPADTAGFADDPAAPQSSVIRLDQRLDSLERQLQEILRQSEENANALRSLQTDLTKLRDDSAARLTALEQRVAAGVAPAQTVTQPAPQPTTGGPDVPAKAKPKPAPPADSAERSANASPDLPADAGEDAYTAGFKLFEAGRYDEAISALRSFVKDYPKHRRVSYANNLIGRSLLDNGQARAATDVLLSNYRKNPGGERAGDSLYYLGQALMKLGQPSQACKVYGEFDAVYGAKARVDLKRLVLEGQSKAGC